MVAYRWRTASRALRYEIFRKKGYDWNADDLDDISIGINYSGDLTYLSIIDWENGMETSVII